MTRRQQQQREVGMMMAADAVLQRFRGQRWSRRPDSCRGHQRILAVPARSRIGSEPQPARDAQILPDGSAG
eukprot:980555-Amphidinium_carterae.2